MHSYDTLYSYDAVTPLTKTEQEVHNLHNHNLGLEATDYQSDAQKPDSSNQGFKFKCLHNGFHKPPFSTHLINSKSSKNEHCENISQT